MGGADETILARLLLGHKLSLFVGVLDVVNVMWEMFIVKL